MHNFNLTRTYNVVQCAQQQLLLEPRRRFCVAVHGSAEHSLSQHCRHRHTSDHTLTTTQFYCKQVHV